MKRDPFRSARDRKLRKMERVWRKFRHKDADLIFNIGPIGLETVRYMQKDGNFRRFR